MNALKKLFANFPKFADRHITVATDCSGIEAPLMALDLLKVKYSHIFSSEVDKNCIEFIERNFPPAKIYQDLKLRDNTVFAKKPLDLYIAGFPCQTFSSLGRNEGFNNSIKGTIFFYVYDFIRVNRPHVFILENVRTLETHDKGKTFSIITSLMAELKDYNIDYAVLNTKDYGIPQSRNRIFIIGIKKSVQRKQFNFPEKLDSLPLKAFLDPKLPAEPAKLAHKNLMTEIISKYKGQHDFLKDLWVLNLNVSSIEWFRKGEKEICPCIVTNSKYYIPNSKYKRYLTPRETLLLQSIPVDNYDFDFPDAVVYKFAGNTISINVIALILSEIFKCTNIGKK